MITRSQYMAGEATHREYYAQFVNDFVKRIVERFIGKKEVLASTDKCFNDIPLEKWDKLANYNRTHVSSSLLKQSKEGWSLSTNICILKEAARQIKESSH